MSEALLSLEPKELVFQGVKLTQAYTQTLRITNNLSAAVDGEVKASSSDRWSVSPASFRVKAGETVDVAVTLKVLKWAQKQKGVEQGQKDAFHIRTTYFDQRFYGTFFLEPDTAGSSTDASAVSSGRSSKAGPHGSGQHTPLTISPRSAPAASAAASPHHSPARPSSEGRPTLKARARAASAGTSPPNQRQQQQQASAAAAPAAAAGAGASASPQASPARAHSQVPSAAGTSSYGANAPANAPPAFGSAVVTGSGASSASSAFAAASGSAFSSRTASARSSGSAASGRDPSPTQQQEQQRQSPARGKATSVPSTAAPRAGPAASTAAPTAVTAGAAASTAPSSSPQHTADGRLVSRWESVRASVRASRSMPGSPHQAHASIGNTSTHSSQSTARRLTKSVSFAAPPSQAADSAAAGAAAGGGGGAASLGQGAAGGAAAGRSGSAFFDWEDTVKAWKQQRSRGSSGGGSADGGRGTLAGSSAGAAMQQEQQGQQGQLELTLSGIAAEGQTVPGHAGSSSGRGDESTSSAHPTSAQARHAQHSDEADQPHSSLQQLLQALEDPLPQTNSWQRQQEQQGQQSAAATTSGTAAAKSSAEASSKSSSGAGTDRSVPASDSTSQQLSAWQKQQTGQQQQDRPSVASLASPLSSLTAPVSLPSASVRPSTASISTTALHSISYVPQRPSTATNAAPRTGDLTSTHSNAAEPSPLQAQSLQRPSTASIGEANPLQAQLSALSEQLLRAEAEAAAGRRLQLELQSRHPDVQRAIEAALRQEQAVQEERNRKALALLLAKDNAVRDLETRCAALQQQLESSQQEAAQQLQQQQQQQQQQLAAARRQAEQQVAAADAQLASSQRKLAEAEARAQEATAEAEDLRRQLRQQRQQGKDLEPAMGEGDGSGDVQRQLRQERQRWQEQQEAHERELAHLQEQLQAAQANARLLQDEQGRQLLEAQQEASRMEIELHQAHKHIHSLEDAAQQQQQGQQQRQQQQQQQQAGGGSPAGSHGSPDMLDVSFGDDAFAFGMSGRHSREGRGGSALGFGSTMDSRDGSNSRAGFGSVIGGRDSRAGSSPDGHAASRLQALRSENERLQAELQGAMEVAGRGEAAAKAEAGRLRVLLGERDGECARLAAELAAARAAFGNEGLLPSGDARAAQVTALTRQLADSNAALRQTQERLSELEALHALAKQTATAAERSLSEARSAAAAVKREAARAVEDADVARHTAALNARASEMALSEAAAVARAQEMEKQLAALGKNGQSVGHRKRQLLQQHIDASDSDHPQHSSHDQSLHRDWEGWPQGYEDVLQQFLEDAELAIAALQSKAVKAERGRLEAEARLAEAEQQLQLAKAVAEQQLAAAREDGSVRVATLEATVQKLSARGPEAAAELGRLGQEAGRLKRNEARLSGELAFTQQRVAEAELLAAELRSQLTALHVQEEERLIHSIYPLVRSIQQQQQRQRHGRQPAPAARRGGPIQAPAASFDESSDAAERSAALQAARDWEAAQVAAQRKLQAFAERAERAEAEMARMGAAGRHGVGKPPRNLSAPSLLALSDGSGHDAPLDVRQRLAAAEAELRIAREQHELSCTESDRLRQQLDAAGRRVAAAAARAAAAEREMHDRVEAAMRQAVQTTHTTNQQLAEAGRSVSDAKSAAEASSAERAEAERDLQSARLEVSRLKAELGRQREAVAAERRSVKKEVEHAKEQAAAHRRCAERAHDESEERRMHIGVLLETVETLQAGSAGEREQRLVSLTAQIAALRSREAALERRADELLAEADDRAQQMAALQTELAAARDELDARALAAATSGASAAALEHDLQELRSQLKGQSQEAGRAARDAESLAQRLAAAEAEGAALAAALEAAQERHAQQLRREREQQQQGQQQGQQQRLSIGAASSQALVAYVGGEDSRLQGSQAASAAHLTRCVLSLDALLSEVRLHVGQCGRGGGKKRAGPAAAGGGEGAGQQWALGVMHKLKDWFLESDRFYQQSEARACLAQDAAAATAARLSALEAALERRTSDWEAAEGAKQHLLRAAGRRVEQASVHAVERMRLQDQRISTLSAQLQELSQDMITLQVSANTAESRAAAERAHASALALQLEAAQAEVTELQARLAAAVMEAGGNAGATESSTPAEALAARDAALMAHFEGSVVRLLSQGGDRGVDSRDKLMALTREVCALKLTESQLLASLAAHTKRADGATLTSQRLKAALDTASAKQAAAAQRAQHAAAGSCEEGGGENEGHGALALQVAHLSAQAAGRAQQLYRLQDQLLQSQQLLESRELELQELQAQAAASELMLMQAREDNAAALARSQEEVAGRHAEEMQRLQQEVQELRHQLWHEAEASAAKLESLGAAHAHALDEAVADAVTDSAAMAAVEEAEERCLVLEERLEGVMQEREALQMQVSNLECQVSDLRDAKEVTSATVTSLEATLARIERAESSRFGLSPRVTMRRGNTAGGAISGDPSRAGSRHASRSGDSSAAEDAPTGTGTGGESVALLSRELVQSKMALADAQRKLRVSARSEAEILQKLAVRDERVSELKQQLAERLRAHEELKRRVACDAGVTRVAGGGLLRSDSVRSSRAAALAGVRASFAGVDAAVGSPRGLGLSEGGNAFSRSTTTGARSAATSPQGGLGRNSASTSFAGADPLRREASTAAAGASALRREASISAAAAGVSANAGIGISRAGSLRREGSMSAAGAGPLHRESSFTATAGHAGLPRSASLRREMSVSAVAAAAQTGLGAAAERGVAAAEKEYLADQIAQLRVALAQRDADVVRLEGALVEAEAQLAEAERQLAEAAAGTAVGGGSEGQGHGLHSHGVSGAGAGGHEHNHFGVNADMGEHASTGAHVYRRTSVSVAVGRSAPGTRAPSRTVSQTGSMMLHPPSPAVALPSPAAARLSRQLSARTATQIEEAFADETENGPTSAHSAATAAATARALAAANGQLSTALATAKLVLRSLMESADGAEMGSAEVSELAGLDLDMVMSEIVYQVQEWRQERQRLETGGRRTLSRVASGLRAAAGQVLSRVGSGRYEEAAGAGAAAGLSRMSSMRSVRSMTKEVAMVASGGDASALAAQVASLAAERDTLMIQLENVVSQLEAATGEKEALLAHAQGLVEERGRLAAQAAAAAAENQSLAAQNATLAAAYTNQLSQQHTDDQDPSEPGAPTTPGPTPAQMKEIAHLMQRLTKENASVIKQRDGLESERSSLLREQGEWRARERELVSEVEAARRLRRELEAAHGSLEEERGALMDQVGELAEDRERLQRQLAAATSERDTLAAQNTTLAQTAQTLMANNADSADQAATVPGTPRSTAAAEAAAAAGGGAPKISPKQLREIGVLLTRLTKDNAAILKQRDRLEAAIEPLQTENARLAQQLERLATEREAAADAREQAAADVDAAAEEREQLAARLRAAISERDALKVHVAAVAAERDSVAAQNATLANTASKLMTGHGHDDDTDSIDGRSAGGAAGAGGRRTGGGAAAAAAVSPRQMREIGALLTRLTKDNADFLRQRDALQEERAVAVAERDAVQQERDVLKNTVRRLEDDIASTRAPSSHRANSISSRGGDNKGASTTPPTAPAAQHSHAGSGVAELRRARSGRHNYNTDAGADRALDGQQASALPEGARALRLCQSLKQNMRSVESAYHAMEAAIAAQGQAASPFPSPRQQQQQGVSATTSAMSSPGSPSAGATGTARSPRGHPVTPVLPVTRPRQATGSDASGGTEGGGLGMVRPHAEVLGAELNSMRAALEALAMQLSHQQQQQQQQQQEGPQQQQQQWLQAARRLSQERTDFSFQLEPLEIPGANDPGGSFPSTARGGPETSARNALLQQLLRQQTAGTELSSLAASLRHEQQQQQQQQQQQGLQRQQTGGTERSSMAASPHAASPRQSTAGGSHVHFGKQQQQQQAWQQQSHAPVSMTGLVSDDAVGQALPEAEASTGSMTGIAALPPAAVAAKLRSYKERAEKWKGRCRALAEQVGLLNAQLHQLQVAAAADEAARQEYQQQQRQQEQGQPQTLEQAWAMQQRQQQQAWAQEQRQAQQQLQELSRAQSGVRSQQDHAAAAEVQELVGKLQKAEQGNALASTLLRRLEERVAAAEAASEARVRAATSQLHTLLNRMDTLARDAQAAQAAAEERAEPLLAAAGSLNAKMAAVERTVKKAHRAHKAQAAEHDAAVQQAARVQASIRELQGELESTTAQYQQQLEAAQQLASAQRAAAEQLASRCEELEVQLQEVRGGEGRLQQEQRLQQLAEEHAADKATAQASLQRKMDELNRRLRNALAAGEAAGHAAASGQLAELDIDERRAEAALQSLHAEFLAYQHQKGLEVASLEARLKGIMLGAGNRGSSSSTIDATGAAATKAAAKGGGRGVRQRAVSRVGVRLLGGSSNARQTVAPKHGNRIAANRRPPAVSGYHTHSQQAAVGGLVHVAGYSAYAHAQQQQQQHEHQQQQQHANEAYGPAANTAANGTAAAAHATAMAVAAQREAEGITAALREVHFERLLRQKAEATAEALRAASARLRARLRAASSEVKVLREAAGIGAVAAVELGSAREEVAKLQHELAAARDAVSRARAEGARRARQAAVDAEEGGLGLGEGGAAAVVAALEHEAAVREGVEGKLKDAKATIDRKNILVRDLRRRVDELQSLLAGTQQQALEEKLGSAETRVKQLVGTLARKDTALKECKEKLEAAGRKLEEAGGSCGAPAEELERQVKMVGRLRAELGRKDMALQAATADLDKARAQAASASRDAEAASKREAHAWRSAGSQAAQLRKRCGQLLAALQSLGRLVLQSATAMQVAAAAVEKSLGRDGEGASDGGSDWRSVPTDAIAEMVSLSMDEVQDLLGAGGSASASAAGGAGIQGGSSGVVRQGTAGSAAQLQQRLEELLLALQASLAQPTPTELGSRESKNRVGGNQAADVAAPAASGADQQLVAQPGNTAIGHDKAAAVAAERMWEGPAGINAVLAALQKEVTCAETALCRATAAAPQTDHWRSNALVAV